MNINKKILARILLSFFVMASIIIWQVKYPNVIAALVVAGFCSIGIVWASSDLEA